MNRLTYELGHKGSGSYEPIQHKAMPANNYIKCVNKLGKLEDLEEEVGCPLEIRCKVIYDSFIYDEDGRKYTEIEIFKDFFIGYNGNEDNNGFLEPTEFNWNDYKIAWWLKEDRSE